MKATTFLRLHHHHGTTGVGGSGCRAQAESKPSPGLLDFYTLRRGKYKYQRHSSLPNVQPILWHQDSETLHLDIIGTQSYHPRSHYILSLNIS